MTAPAPLPTVCAALGDPTRWEILTLLGEGPRSASALARIMPVSRQAIIKHLDVLRQVGLITSEQRGREVVHLALGTRLTQLAAELDRIGSTWDTRLRNLKHLAEQPPPAPGT